MERPDTLVAAVAREIRSGIIRGDYQPEARLPEITLATSLQVSRTTVREALRSLVEEGLVEVHPHRGAVVAGISRKQASEIFKVRSLLEASAAAEGLAGGKPSEAALLPARTALEQMQLAAERAGGDEDLLAYGAADIEFHLAISSLANNDTLVQVIASLHARARRYVVLTNLAGTDLPAQAASHRRIFEAAESGDPDVLVSLVKAHIEESGGRLLRRMDSLTGA